METNLILKVNQVNYIDKVTNRVVKGFSYSVNLGGKNFDVNVSECEKELFDYLIAEGTEYEYPLDVVKKEFSDGEKIIQYNQLVVDLGEKVFNIYPKQVSKTLFKYLLNKEIN